MGGRSDLPLFIPGDVQFLLAWIVGGGLRLLPGKWRAALLGPISQTLSGVWYRAGLGDPRRVRHNLQALFSISPDSAGLEEEVRRALRLAVWNSMVVDLLPSLNDREAADLLEVRGLAHLDAARQSGRPVLLVGAHYGPYAYAVTAVLRARGYPVAQVGYHARPKLSGSRMYLRLYWPRVVELLDYLDIRDLESDSPGALIDLLLSEKIVYILLDEYFIPDPSTPLPPHAVAVPLLGRQGILGTECLALAKREGAEILTVLPLAEADGMEIEVEPLSPVTAGVALPDLRADLTAFMARVERRLQRRPSLWRDLRRHDLLQRVRAEDGRTQKENVPLLSP